MSSLLLLSGASGVHAAVVIQGGDPQVAFQAETAATLLPGKPENWVVKADATASGGGAIYADGTNSTGDSPHSFAQYQIQFAKAGTYSVYYRWRADEARTGGDAFTANSSWIATRFGAFSTAGAAAQADYVRTKSNDASAPADNAYAWVVEPGTYTVAASDLAAPVVLTIGSREAGMFFDRFVFSPIPDLTPAQLDALVNSGTRPPSPEVASVVGSATLNEVTLVFSRPLDAASVTLGSFVPSPALGIIAAQVDTADARIVRLTTAAQPEGIAYMIAVSGVRDDKGTLVAAGTKAQFTSWRRVEGWATKEVFFGITGTTVADLTAAPNYLAGKPDRFQWVKGFQLNQSPLTDNYGARLSAFFSPDAAGVHSLFIDNDDEAELLLSTDTSASNLASLGVFPLNAAFDDGVSATTPPLGAGRRYLLVGLLKQGGGDVHLNVGARPQNGTTPAAQVPVLAGGRISTYVNPDAGKVSFKQQPVDAKASANGRATFRVVAEAPASPLYHQWQVDGVDIPGAVRSTYTTPVLGLGDNGKKYRCVISVAGVDTASSTATLAVSPGDPSGLQPFVGINFIGGGTAGGASLSVVDVAGVVPQENWNNLGGIAFDAVAVRDAAGSSTPVTLTTAQAMEVWYTGSVATGDADGALFQGFLNAQASHDPVHVRLDNIPAGKYQVLVYSLGFDFTPAYETAFELTGGGSYPVYHGRSETGLPYQKAPAFRRITSTTAAAPASGNYVQFDNVSPASDGSLDLSVTWESIEAGNGHQPAINAIQLVKVVDVAKPLGGTTASVTPAGIVLNWTGGNGPFLVQGKLGVTDAWIDLQTTTARTTTIPTASFAGFFRIVDGTTKTVKLFKASLNGANERPTAVTTAGTGTGLIALDGLTATYVVGYQGLTAAPVAYHLHGLGGADAAVGVKFALVPSGALGTSGLFVGQATVDQATADGIAAGQTYFNVHTAAFGGGEIRGQVVP